MINFQLYLKGFALGLSFLAVLQLEAAEHLAEHFTQLEICEQLSPDLAGQSLDAYEECTKKRAPDQIAHYFSDIYQKIQGKVTLSYLDGTSLVLQDYSADNVERYQRFSLWGCEKNKRYCVIFKAGWEWWSYLLIDRKTKITSELTGYPVFSTDSQLVFEYLDTRISDTFDRNLIKLYQLNEAKPKLLLAMHDADFGVKSAEWLGSSTLKASLQDLTYDGVYRYVASGEMNIKVTQDKVTVTIEKATPR